MSSSMPSCVLSYMPSSIPWLLSSLIPSQESSQEVIEIDQDFQDEDDYNNIGDDFRNYLQE
ncbi:hypothetical protein Glove_335g2 [Diversispora epigaea]|uniref:Uncharacterized protein n=1 Tax=Diversispora epigaea TaxID=1348612 RepID=A0A397HN42_9GLOM|nr:hypothetical protein Glove_335g2 [Diversispora epigaea]